MGSRRHFPIKSLLGVATVVLDDREQVEKTAQALVQVQESAGTVICLERESRFLYGHEAGPDSELVLGNVYYNLNFLRGVI